VRDAVLGGEGRGPLRQHVEAEASTTPSLFCDTRVEIEPSAPCACYLLGNPAVINDYGARRSKQRASRAAAGPTPGANPHETEAPARIPGRRQATFGKGSERDVVVVPPRTPRESFVGRHGRAHVLGARSPRPPQHLDVLRQISVV